MRFTYLSITLFLFSILFMQCTRNTENNQNDNNEPVEVAPDLGLRNGEWRVLMYLDSNDMGIYLPFNMLVNRNTVTIKNAEESIEIEEYRHSGDTTILVMPVFGTELHLTKNNDQELKGFWINSLRSTPYNVPLVAFHGDHRRFQDEGNNTPNNIQGRWKVTFSPDTDDAYTAIGIFNQMGGRITGTFMTETGDYRHLEGHFGGHYVNLSTFDGSHAFLFKAEAKSNSSMEGTFWSGLHWQEKWIAERDENFELPDAETLTKLKDGATTLNFSFPNLENKMISLQDEQYKDKVCIVQILGSWCPNCMDETRFFVELYNEYHDQGLEIIGIDFEPGGEFKTFEKNVGQMTKDLKVPYEVTFGGTSKKSEAAKALPELEHIMSYPTSVFIDRTGTVKYIHTGFSGPATGEHYNFTTETMRNWIETMLK